MKFLNNYKSKILAAAAIVTVLSLTFLWGGDFPENPSLDIPVRDIVTEVAQTPGAAVQNTEEPAPEAESVAEYGEQDPQAAWDIDSEDTTYPEQEPLDENHYTEGQEDENALAEQGTDDTSVKEMTCTLSVRCDTILNNISYLNDDKANIVPKDGVIFPETTVIFYEGESVFNLLCREMKKNKIHLEFVNTPVYDSTYIEGIANIYEFDCGELSGWMYKVNDRFPNYSCSHYQLNEGDKVEFVYTCDLGKDVGGDYSARNGR